MAAVIGILKGSKKVWKPVKDSKGKVIGSTPVLQIGVESTDVDQEEFMGEMVGREVTVQITLIPEQQQGFEFSKRAA